MADAHYNLGTVLQELGDREQAAEAYREAIRLRPDMALAHNNLGNICKLLGNTAEAIACYERAVGIQPEQAEALDESRLGAATAGAARRDGRLLPEGAALEA